MKQKAEITYPSGDSQSLAQLEPGRWDLETL